MTETENRSPELRLAMGALSGLREDLVEGTLAYRPLPRMRTDGAYLRKLPARLREYAAWAPHAVVLGCALLTVLVATTVGASGWFSGATLLLLGGVSAVPVALTLFRPVLAWWLSLVATLLSAGLASGGFGATYPWIESAFVGHLVVMVVVAARTRPRTAGWMWVLTLVFGLMLSTNNYGGADDTAAMAFLSLFALLVVTVLHIRREAKEEVTVQRTVTAVERDRRTLLEERTTIARELHDVVAHHMSVVAIQAEAAPYRVENPPPELEQAFVTIRENAVAALTELRRVLGVVRAEDHEAPDAPQPTLAELDGLLSNVRDAGLTADKTVTGSVRDLPQGVELSAYRIIQEALSNALRHAPGATAKVEVSYVLGGLGLRIVNTAPQGLVKPSPGAGHGITGMRERVSMLNGEMTAEATEDGGYEVSAFIPVAPAAPVVAPEPAA
ncbi:two-component sensor histidine kinase [Streptomyces agglomeratus]|uniref:histidine kinase n=2 Tax=Streptomyces agglomeratus TaxID=285458 RepID=A0A1E5P8I5_9ACTN|nr:histidine kinase [Streptomyces agglomeratus]OEJ25852.1 two-component sensor histidine kinase [Streptomyces agglomeratus]OEJ52652.1 two-component sensor histidine kinase [Streptomyces agglomeratus]